MKITSQATIDAIRASIRCVGEHHVQLGAHASLRISSIGLYSLRTVTAWLTGPHHGWEHQVFSARTLGHFNDTARAIVAAIEQHTNPRG